MWHYSTVRMHRIHPAVKLTRGEVSKKSQTRTETVSVAASLEKYTQEEGEGKLLDAA